MDTQQNEVLPPIEIPLDKVSAEAIDGLIEEYILREGTDYGAIEINFATKKQQIYKLLENNDIKIVFDWATLTPTLI